LIPYELKFYPGDLIPLEHKIQQGESLAYVRDQLGHHSTQITVDTYGHLVPVGNRAAVNRLDDATIRN
jgi:hypothetical protein